MSEMLWYLILITQCGETVKLPDQHQGNVTHFFFSATLSFLSTLQNGQNMLLKLFLEVVFPEA